jgi:hypothetical protein
MRVIPGHGKPRQRPSVIRSPETSPVMVPVFRIGSPAGMEVETHERIEVPVRPLQDHQDGGRRDRAGWRQCRHKAPGAGTARCEFPHIVPCPGRERAIPDERPADMGLSREEVKSVSDFEARACHQMGDRGASGRAGSTSLVVACRSRSDPVQFRGGVGTGELPGPGVVRLAVVSAGGGGARQRLTGAVSWPARKPWARAW